MSTYLLAADPNGNQAGWCRHPVQTLVRRHRRSCILFESVVQRRLGQASNDQMEKRNTYIGRMKHYKEKGNAHRVHGESACFKVQGPIRKDCDDRLKQRKRGFVVITQQRVIKSSNITLNANQIKSAKFKLHLPSPIA